MPLNLFFRFGKRLRRTKIRTRLLLSFLSLSVIPILFIGVLSVARTYRDMEEKAIEYSLNISSQIVNNIIYLFDNYIDKFERIALNSTILADMYNYEGLKEYRQIEVDNRIRYTLASIVGIGEGIDSIELCTRNNERFYYSYPISRGSVTESALLRNADESEGIVWKVARKEIEEDDDIYIILSKKMKIQFATEVTGYALMSIQRDFIDKICRSGPQEGNSFVVITDRDGIVVSHPDGGRVLTPFNSIITEKITEFERDHQNGMERNHIFRVNTGGEILLVAYGILPRNEWRVINIIPYNQLMRSTIDNGLITLFTVLLCIAVAVITTLSVTRSISTPIKDLMSIMSRAGKGDLDVRVEENWNDVKDELALLSHGFNDMISRLKKLIDDVYQSQLKEKQLVFLKKEAELNALQQQINPHFLYNTLEAIFWTAQMKGEEEISEMVTALGDFFRTSINKGLEYISIADEIKNVKTYVYLQKIRFKNRFSVEWDINEELLQYKTIKLILQPIIENAIVHGIEGMNSGGLIIIKGNKTEEEIIFEVEDNGVGMSGAEVKKLEAFINSPEQDTERSIGVKNVNQRIRLYFGEEYGISITSSPGRGTTVRMVLPVFKHELHTSYPLVEGGEAHHV